MNLTREAYAHLVRMLDVTLPEEIDCTELVDRVAGYVEHLRRGGEPLRGYEAVVQHLQVCSECLELFEALYEVIEEQQSQHRG